MSEQDPRIKKWGEVNQALDALISSAPDEVRGKLEGIRDSLVQIEMDEFPAD